MLQINVTIPASDVRYYQKLVDMPKEVPGAIRRGLDSALAIVADRIQNVRLSGSGPYPVSQHRLGERSGALRDSVYTRTLIQGGNVIGEIGSDPGKAPYAVVHEYGAVINARNAPFLVFKVLGQTVRTKQVTIPARAPFTTEMQLKRTTDTIAKEVVDEVTSLGSP